LGGFHPLHERRCALRFKASAVMPRKIRLPHTLNSYLRARFKHFFMSYDESETTSGMQFVAIFYIPGLRLTIQKKSDFLNSKLNSTVYAACTCVISREEGAWRRGTRGRKSRGEAHKRKKKSCVSFSRETGNAGGTRACFPNGRKKLFYHSELSSSGRRSKRAGCGRVRSRNIFLVTCLL
jgi:hypothetical protein